LETDLADLADLALTLRIGEARPLHQPAFGHIERDRPGLHEGLPAAACSAARATPAPLTAANSGGELDLKLLDEAEQVTVNRSSLCLQQRAVAVLGGVDFVVALGCG